jgi:hypothetical protein
VRLYHLAVAAWLVCVSQAAAQKPDSAAFIIRLGNDTTAIERYIRTGDQLIVEALQRSPTTMMHRLVLDLTPQNSVRRAVYAVMRPGSDQHTLDRTYTYERDSVVVVSKQGSTVQTRTAGKFAINSIPIMGPFYSPYELAIMRGIAAGAKTRVALLAGDTVSIPIERVGRDSVTLTNQFAEPMRAHIDAAGRLLHLNTPAYTSVERLRWIDLDAMAREFAARDATGKGLGPLSPRQAYRARVKGANVWIDYSRPAARGRPLWGALVPYGNVWRLGANDAAHIAVDKTIQMGDLTLAPGTYTLFLLPTADDWTLIVNRQTGMSGLDYDAAQDVGRVKLQKQTLERPAESLTIDVQETTAGGTLGISWGSIRASVPFTVK